MLKKKRQLYKHALGFNGNTQKPQNKRATKSISTAPKVDKALKSAQLARLPPKVSKTESKVHSTLDSYELNSSKDEAVKQRNVDADALELQTPKASLPIANVSKSDLAPQNNIVAKIEFKINEVIWCKIRGWPAWPCRIRTFVKNMAIVVWFNDYRITKVYRTQLQKFLTNSIHMHKISMETLD